LAKKVAAPTDIATSKRHDTSESIIASFEGLTIGETPIDEKIQDLSEEVSEERAQARRTQTERHPSIKRMPHVVGVSSSSFNSSEFQPFF
jgi:hypothetical protein